jgi:epothilone synthetase B
LMAHLETLGVVVASAGSNLSISAPKGVLTPVLRQRLADHKSELLALLNEPEDDAHEPFPLTDIQQAYLVGRSSQIPLGSISCHFYREFEATDLDPWRLESAWRQVIHKHAMLRTVVDFDGTQRLLRNCPDWRMPIHDFRSLTSPEAKTAALKIRERMAHATFAADSWPLFDIQMTLLPGNRQRLHFSFDLLIADAAGIRRLFKDWQSFYASYEASAADTEPAAYSFRRYVLALKAAQQTSEFAASLRYWCERIPHLPAAPELPLATVPERISKPRFERRQMMLDATIWSALQQRAAEWEITPTALICAAFAEVLGRWSRRQALTLTLTYFQALPVHPDVRLVVGDFTSTLFLAFAAEGNSFRERAQALHRQLLDDLNHAQVSGVRALREAGVNSAAHTYGFPVVFTSALGHRGGNELAWLGRTVYTLTETPQVWLDHVAAEEEGQLVLSWDAVEDLFPAGMLDDMFAAEERLLRSLAEDQAADWAFSPAQIEERVHWNRTEGPVPQGLLHEPFLKQVEQQPKAIAIIDSERTLTYGDLHRQAGLLAARLVQAGVVPGDRVAILLAKGWRQVCAVLACGYCGAVYVPLDPDWPETRVRVLLQRVQAKAVLIETLGETAGDNCIAVNYEPEGRIHTPLTAGPARSERDPAYIIFTSGSTGEPKGVVIDHRGARNTIEDVNERCSITAGDCVLSLSALHFDLSVYDIFGLLGAGGKIVLPDPRQRANAAHWNQLVATHAVTIWNSVPALFRMAVDSLSEKAELRSLRSVWLSGDWISPTLIDDARELLPGTEFISMGGATEASIWSIWHRIGAREPGWTSVPYGRPMRNQTFHILNAQQQDCPVWVPGQLYIGGIGVALEYWNDPERTGQQFITDVPNGGRLYATGDIGRYRPGGLIEFLGREDQQVKVQGYRIELGEIESAMFRHPKVAAAVAVVRGKAFEPKHLVGYAVCREESTDAWAPADEAGIISDQAERLAKTMALHGRTENAELALPDGFPRKGLDAFKDRRSVREFSSQPVPQSALAGLLGCLRPVGVNDADLPLFLYPSAGHSYRLTAYFYCPDQRVEGLTGFFRYVPQSHGLRKCGHGDLSRALHAARNQAIFDSSAFSLFLVADVESLQPLYGSASRDLCLLEAGYMGQTLMIAAADAGIGLCAIGAMDVGEVHAALGLRAGEVILHSFLGGIPLQPSLAKSSQQKAGQKLTPAALREFLEGELPSYMVPAKIVFLDRLPLTANGKVDKAALRDPQETDSAPAQQPGSGVADWLIPMVKEILGGVPVDPQANFFELGATSLHLVQLARRLEAEGKRVPITDLFRYSSVSSLAHYLESNGNGSADIRQAASARGLSRRHPKGGQH